MEIRQISPTDERAMAFIRDLDDFQANLYPAESNHLDDIDVLIRPNVYFVGAVQDRELMGIGAVKRLEDYGEIKRMFVPEKYRGLHIGLKIIQALEIHLLEHGISVIRLETGIKQLPAIRLYEKTGFLPCSPFGQYKEDPLSLFMEKQLKIRE